MITIRPASLDDMPWIVEQSKGFAQFVGGKRQMAPKEEKLRSLVETQIVLIAENGQGPMGFIAGVLTPNYWDDSITQLTEIAWWVAPEYRGTRAALTLLNAFDAIGEKRADQTFMALESDSPVNPRTLEKRGFRLKETSYLKEST